MYPLQRSLQYVVGTAVCNSDGFSIGRLYMLLLPRCCIEGNAWQYQKTHLQLTGLSQFCSLTASDRNDGCVFRDGRHTIRRYWLIIILMFYRDLNICSTRRQVSLANIFAKSNFITVFLSILLITYSIFSNFQYDIETYLCWYLADLRNLCVTLIVATVTRPSIGFLWNIWSNLPLDPRCAVATPTAAHSYNGNVLNSDKYHRPFTQ